MGCTEAVAGGILRKKVCLKISQNSQEHFCARVSFLIKLLKKKNETFDEAAVGCWLVLFEVIILIYL